MTLSTRLKDWLNGGLRPLNLRLDTLTAENAELSRLRKLEAAGHFDGPVFPILRQFSDCDPASLLEAVAGFADQFASFGPDRGHAFTFENYYFTSPDAEVAYALTRLARPKRILEVGSGNSTLLFRSAISDGGLTTELVSIDPAPRRQIDTVADRLIPSAAEKVPLSEYESLEANDILFIDSSHDVRAGNDVTTLILKVIPALNEGVIVHFHDIRLPYEYPLQWIKEHHWNEQYLVQAMMQESEDLEVLWPGYYLQRSMPAFSSHFPWLAQRVASSLWLRIVRDGTASKAKSLFENNSDMLR